MRTSRARDQAKLAARLPPVWGDATQLRQIIHNLLRNAEDAQEAEASPSITISTRPPRTWPKWWFAIKGPGFPPEIIARVFEPYVTTKARGTGLGLAIVKKIVDEHHGRISINNRQPVGAEVSILLPLASTADPRDAKQTSFRDLTMAQVLIVDDEMGIRELLSEILADEGHSVWLAENAAAARRRAESVPTWSCSTSGCPIPTVSRCSRSGRRAGC
jgi:anti-sigma regulatory factor (Ser/Thr protein kinase)